MKIREREKSNLIDVVEMYYWIQWKSSQCDCVIYTINIEYIEQNDMELIGFVNENFRGCKFIPKKGKSL